MLFSSITFLYYFLPAFLLVYFAVPAKMKNIILLIGSLFFYAWGEPRYIVLMTGTILIGWLSGIRMEKLEDQKKRKALLAGTICICLGILGVFKYADFVLETLNCVLHAQLSPTGLALPIGISFYTFQLISYLVDVYRGQTEAQKNLLSFALYICMFPQLIAGPIVRYRDIQSQLNHRSVQMNQISDGITRFCIGLGKKILLANSLGELCKVYGNLNTPTVLFTWMYGIAVALQIYFDFSGYSDMAIGIGKILGFSFPENFDHPFTAGSATEFWRRWHMTLGSWFRDYLYIPLGGSRVKGTRHLFNILVVWMATGIWHGAGWNFILWGMYFAVILVIEKYILLKQLKRHKLLSHIYLPVLVMISFLLFDNTDVLTGFSRIGALFGAGGIPFSSADTLFYLKDYGTLLLIAGIGSTALPLSLLHLLKEKGFGKEINAAVPLFNAVLLIFCTAFLVNGSFNPFLYFRF